jgi:hypothetical protein
VLVVRDVEDQAVVLTLPGITCARELAPGAVPRRVLVRDCNRTVHLLDAADWMQCRDEFVQAKLSRYRQR